MTSLILVVFVRSALKQTIHHYLEHKSMAALPYMQLYVADYLADTAHLSTEEHGAYLLLIFNYWQRGKPLPNNDKRLAMISRLSNERWADVKETLIEFFNVTPTEWKHERIERDLIGVNSKSSAASIAGKASAEAKKAKKLAELAELNETLTDVTTDVTTDVKQTINHTDTDTDTDKEIKDSCADPLQESPQKKNEIAIVIETMLSPTVIEFPLNKKGEFHSVTQSDMDELLELYPAADVSIELKKMRKWLNDNTSRRKTKGGINKFITGWLSKAQNNPSPSRSAYGTASYGEKQVNGLKDAYTTFGLQEVKPQEMIGYEH